MNTSIIMIMHYYEYWIIVCYHCQRPRGPEHLDVELRMGEGQEPVTARSICLSIYLSLSLYIYIYIYTYTYISRPRGDRKFGVCFYWVAWAAILMSQF